MTPLSNVAEICLKISVGPFQAPSLLDTLQALSALSAVLPPQANEQAVRLPAEAAAFDLGTGVEPIQESDAAMSSRIGALLARLQGSQMVQPSFVERAGSPPSSNRSAMASRSQKMVLPRHCSQ